MTVIWEIKTFTFEEKLAQFRGALVEVLGFVVLGAAEDVLPSLVVELPSLVVEPALLAVVLPLLDDELHGDGVVLAVVVAVAEVPHELTALRRASKRLQLLLPSSVIVLTIVSSANDKAKPSRSLTRNKFKPYFLMLLYFNFEWMSGLFLANFL